MKLGILLILLTQRASPEDLDVARRVVEAGNDDVLVGLKTSSNELLSGLHRFTVEVRIGQLLLDSSLDVQEADMGSAGFLSPGVEEFGEGGGAHVV